MTARLKQIDQWLRQRTRRERWLVAFAPLVAVIVLGDMLLTAPQQRALRNARQQFDEVQAEVVALQTEVAALSGQISVDPNRALKAEIETLKADHAELDEQLRAVTVGLISPEEMTSVLREMLADEKGLELVRLANEPAEPVRLPGAADDGAEAPPRLYRHRLVLEVVGSYLQTLDYLKRLESLDRAFYWDGLEINVARYPRARVVIRLSTLGLREGWIGV